MTETELDPLPATTASSSKANAGTWDAAFSALKARFPKAKDSIVFCIHALQTNPEIAIDDLKAQATMHSIRVTGASVTAAQRLLSRQGGNDEPTSAKKPKATVTATTAPTGRVRRPRAPVKDVDAEALIRGVVGKLQQAGNAETERLRDAIRRAIAALQVAVDA